MIKVSVLLFLFVVIAGAVGLAWSSNRVEKLWGTRLGSYFTTGGVSGPEELYTKFLCPCCGDKLDECECEQAQARKAFIDSLYKDGSPETPVLAYVRRYGVQALASKTERREYREKLQEASGAQAPRLKLGESRKDLGVVRLEKGEVKTTFDLTNTGRKPLKIRKIKTSCACTTTAVSRGIKRSPRFNMQGEAETDYEPIVIPPGEAATLHVYYDPTVHPDLSGEVTRRVAIHSNDPAAPVKQLHVEIHQKS